MARLVAIYSMAFFNHLLSPTTIVYCVHRLRAKKTNYKLLTIIIIINIIITIIIFIILIIIIIVYRLLSPPSNHESNPCSCVSRITEWYGGLPPWVFPMGPHLHHWPPHRPRTEALCSPTSRWVWGRDLEVARVADIAVKIQKYLSANITINFIIIIVIPGPGPTLVEVLVWFRPKN